MEYAGSNPVYGAPNKEEKMKFSTGDKVKTTSGLKGKVIQTDSARSKVAIKATNDGVGHSVGDEVVFNEQQVKKD